MSHKYKGYLKESVAEIQTLLIRKCRKNTKPTSKKVPQKYKGYLKQSAAQIQSLP